LVAQRRRWAHDAAPGQRQRHVVAGAAASGTVISLNCSAARELWPADVLKMRRELVSEYLIYVDASRLYAP
jgi:hypothetical protein